MRPRTIIRSARALRLMYLHGYTQAEACKKAEISRDSICTFTRSDRGKALIFQLQKQLDELDLLRGT